MLKDSTVEAWQCWDLKSTFTCTNYLDAQNLNISDCIYVSEISKEIMAWKARD